MKYRSGLSRRNVAIGSLELAIILFALVILIAPQVPSRAAGTGDVPTYMGSNTRDGYYPNETGINPGNASRLAIKWKLQAGGSIDVQPVILNGIIYWGSWDGYEHATRASDGAEIWKTNIGKTISAGTCTPKNAGPAGTATIVQMAVNGATEVVFVPGGDTAFYALDAASGHILWKTSLGASPNEMLWGGSAVYNGNVYTGISSYGDCPLTPGHVFELSGTTGAILHQFNTTAHNCPGAGAWDAPTIDETAGTLFITTGTIASCNPSEIYAYALLELRASDLALLGHWQIPKSQQTGDGDFGSTATLFTATINGTLHQMIGTVDKNGIYYAFDRNDISAGPLWERVVGMIKNHDKSSRASSAWDGSTLYEGNTTTTINGQSCKGSVRAINPANGAFLWEYCAPGKVTAGLTVVPGLVIVGAYSDLVVLNAATGKKLFLYHDPSALAEFWGTVTVSNGVVYVGNRDGALYAFVVV
ncbi:MAG TPA: PQQ-binding-like beta-propeller repeat protein [Ktedonobacteraceae bacterium]|nr:PQQ-binding-like beta-propeller repeat protein [Ktedonobacteraceae bacterium]